MVDVLNKLLFIYFTRDVLYLTFPKDAIPTEKIRRALILLTKSIF